MSFHPEQALGDDAILAMGEPATPEDAWTSDELDQLGALDSLRSAWAETGDSAP